MMSYTTPLIQLGSRYSWQASSRGTTKAISPIKIYIYSWSFSGIDRIPSKFPVALLAAKIKNYFLSSQNPVQQQFLWWTGDTPLPPRGARGGNDQMWHDHAVQRPGSTPGFCAQNQRTTLLDGKDSRWVTDCGHNNGKGSTLLTFWIRNLDSPHLALMVELCGAIDEFCGSRIELTYQLSKFSFSRNFHVLLSW